MDVMAHLVESVALASSIFAGHTGDEVPVP